jgi:putative ATP-dependent endonuclease of the OLD family
MGVILSFEWRIFTNICRIMYKEKCLILITSIKGTNATFFIVEFRGGLMYLKQVKIYNFRKFEQKENGEPGVVVSFNENFNLLIGENDAGKSAIIDAIRLTLGTLSMENPRLSEEDFYNNKAYTADELKIECFFSGLNEQEAGVFLEWLSFNEKGEYELEVRLYGKKIKNSFLSNRVETSITAGPINSDFKLEGEAKELLKTTYLKPLRDAENELRPGFRSRLAQILQGHSAFKTKENEIHDLEKILGEANKELEEYFDSKSTGKKSIKAELVSYLDEFFPKTNEQFNPNFEVTPVKLSSILRKLALTLDENVSGLGSLNLLFIAAELLLLSDKENIGPSITLIEEIEAHLHPQAQLRLIKFLQETLLNESSNTKGQFILSTHSTSLAASVSLENLILIHNNFAYPLSSEHTKLESDDYKFLERFLDATKSNLFFAKGVILVEGDAENLLIPALAEAINRPLHKYGVSIVNLGSTAFKRYANIFSRSDVWYKQGFPTLNLPVSLITDSDVKPYEYYVEEQLEVSEFVIKNQNHLNEITTTLNLQNDYDYEELEKTSFSKISDLKRVLIDTYDIQQNQLDDDLIISLTKINIDKDYTNSLETDRINTLEEKYSTNPSLKVFVAKHWTLEYMLSLSSINKYLATVIHEIRYKHPYSTSNKKKLEEIEKLISNPNRDNMVVAYKIFKPIKDKIVSKAVVAQELAAKIHENKLEIRELIEKDLYLSYLLDAIYHVTEPK